LVGLARAAIIIVAELDLNSEGQAYEIFIDLNGNLWISDFGAGEIWQVDTVNNTYTVYGQLGNPSDAKVDANGDLWWSDTKTNRVGHLVPNQQEADMWSLTGNVSQTIGLAIESNGTIWVTDEVNPIIHNLFPTKNEICSYAIPDSGSSSYIVTDSGRVWLADWRNNRILALDPEVEEFEIWQLDQETDSNIYGIDADDQHNIWWADQYQNYIGRLNPSNNLVTTYTLPIESFGPTVVSTNRSWVWSSGWGIGWVARLSPEEANGKSATLQSTSHVTSKECTNEVTSTKKIIELTGPHDFDWVGDTYNRVFDFDGWHLYQIYPLDASIGAPWGIAASSGDVYIVDQGRQKVTHLQICFDLNLTHSGPGEDPSASPENSLICPEGEYLAGELVTITAHPAPGFGVISWIGTDSPDKSDLTSTVTMPLSSHTVIVNYGPNTYLPALFK
jgi:streptogramin lyase